MLTIVPPSMIDISGAVLGMLTPEQFGAIGDGVSDDSAAWVDLIAAASATKTPVLARRDYYVPDGITLASDVHIDGGGTGKIRSNGVVREALYGDGVSNVSIRNLSVFVPRSNLRSGKFCIIVMEGSNIRIDNVRTDGGTVGIWTLNCSDVKVTNCYIDTPKADGIHFGHGSKNCEAIGNTVKNSGDDAFSTTFYTGYSRPSDIIFANNIVLGTIWGCGIAAYSADNVTIVGNTIKETALSGISVGIHEDTTGCGRVSVVGNTISLAGRADKQPESYWFGTDPGLDPAVTSMSHKSALVVNASVVEVKANNIGIIAATPLGDPRHGIAIESGYSIDISDNFLHGVSGLGIISQSGGAPGGLWITNNKLEEVAGTAIKIDGAITSYVVIDGNKGGNGQAITGHLVEVSNTGSAKAIVRNNYSLIGRTCVDLGGNGNYSASGNI